MYVTRKFVNCAHCVATVFVRETYHLVISAGNISFGDECWKLALKIDFPNIVINSGIVLNFFYFSCI